MARGGGRPVVAIILSDEERSYLERQARRDRVGRSFSERCQIISHCAEGLPSTVVGAHCEGPHRRSSGRAAAGPPSPHPGRSGGGGDRAHAGHNATGRDAPVDPLDGALDQALAYDGPADLERLRSSAAPHGDVQTF